MAGAQRSKRVFLSSTVYDLRKERALIRRLLESYDRVPQIRFEVLQSDHPDFPLSPADRAQKHSYDLCIEQVAKADYFVMLLNQRYGDRIITDGKDQLSITHREFREALLRRVPRFVLLNQKTWDAKLAHKQGAPQTHVSNKHLPIFDFIDEVRLQSKGNWIDMYSDLSDIETIIRTFLDRYDDSAFVCDVSIPNGHQVRGGTRFIKTWEIENTGLQVWEQRLLREENAGASGLVPDKPLVRIPKTVPGERVKISVQFTAPEYPATCESIWKMVDRSGVLSFPHKVGLECRVRVI